MPDTHSRAFLKDNLVAISGQILIYLRGVILMPLIIKTVGVTVYGGYALLASILGFTFGVSSLGVGFRCRRFLPSAAGVPARRDLFYPQLLFQGAAIAVAALLFMLLGVKIKSIFFKDEVDFSLLLCALYLPVYLIYSQTNDYYRYTHRVRRSMAQSILYAYLHVAVMAGIFLAFRTMTVTLLLASEICSLTAVSLPLAFLIARELGIGHRGLDIPQVISDIRLGFPLVVSYVVDTVLGVSDRFIIAFFLSVTDVGYYNPGYALGGLIALLPKAAGMVLPQMLSRSVDQGREGEAQATLNYALKGFLFLAIPYIVGATVLGRPLLVLLSNAAVADRALLVIPLVATGMVFYGLYIMLSNVLFVRMKTGALLRMNAIVAISSLTLNCILLYYFKSILVTAVTALLCFLVVFTLIARAVREDWPVQFDTTAIMKSVGAALLMGAVLIWTSRLEASGLAAILAIATQAVVGVIVYFLGLLALRAVSVAELRSLKQLLA